MVTDAGEGTSDVGIIAWHEDGRWNAATLDDTSDIGEIIERLKAQRTNGGAIALLTIDDEFFIVARSLGQQQQIMVSDITYALEYDIVADIVDILDLPFPEENDESQPGGDIDLLTDLGMNAMELEALSTDPELYPDEQIVAIASRIGFGDLAESLLEDLGDEDVD